MEELVSYHGHSITSIAPKSSTHFSQLGAMGQSCIEQGWRSLYTMKEIASCIEKIQPVRFTETLTLFSTLRLEAHSSGHSLGSANWLLETSYKKIVFLSSSSLVTGLHPLDFDTSVLKNADVIHVSDLTNQSHLDLSFQRSKAKMMSYIGRALQARGNVLFPIPTMGIIFDLIGEIRNYLLSVGVEIGHETHQIPIYMVGPMANRSLQYANICGEWMTPELQEQLYVPKMPLPHGLLLKSGGLQAVGSISLDVKAKKDFKEPCIVFTGDYACPTNGPVSWFLKKWGNSEHNVCIVVVPSFDVPLGCRMTVLRAPLDTRITLTEVGRLLTMNWMRKLDGSPRHIIIPKCQGATQFQEDWRQKGADVHIYTSGDILDVDLKRKWDKVTISEKLSQLEPQAPGSASYLLPISGSLHLHNNQLVLGDMNSGPSTRAITLADNRTPIQPVDAISIMKRLKEVRN
ncbi:beta-lactamase-like protein [Phycomyces blakesleeanus]|uniref:Beta-lactamase-like protein n=1 Tax=Phycomyces blakesleeanus TaxID=4837 RepID=A0ABR3AWA5_PHYBL